jgi:Family of unknown function (DUF5898)
MATRRLKLHGENRHPHKMVNTDPLDTDFQNQPPTDPATIANLLLEEIEDSKQRTLVRMLLGMTIDARNELSHARNELDQRSLKAVRDLFPALLDRTGSPPYFPTNKKHEHADVNKNSIDDEVLSQIKDLMGGNFLRAPFLCDKPGQNCDSERDAQSLVVALLKAVLKGLELSDVIGVVQDLNLVGVQIDVSLVHLPSRLPFAAVEVKKPGNNLAHIKIVFEGKEEEGGNRVAGETFNEMMAISLFGFKEVFGMLSTGNQWRLVSTTDSVNGFLKGTAQETLRYIMGTLLHHEVGIVDQESPPMGQVDFSGKNTVKKVERTIFASQIVPELFCNGEDAVLAVSLAGQEILQLITLFVLKACCSLCERGWTQPQLPASIYGTMAARILDANKNHNVFAFGTEQLKELHLHAYNPELGCIYVIHHLGTGEHGSCCLGISDGGFSCCVVKFYHSKADSKSLAESELHNWNAVYGNRENTSPPICRTLPVPGGKCLVMPYLFPVKDFERQSLLEDGTIEQVLRKFAELGYIHNDIKWRHFGYWESKLYLIDLGDIKEQKEQQKATSWVGNSIDYLRTKVIETKISTPDNKSSGNKRSHENCAHEGTKGPTPPYEKKN